MLSALTVGVVAEKVKVVKESIGSVDVLCGWL